jgi:hypothetical protein
MRDEDEDDKIFRQGQRRAAAPATARSSTKPATKSRRKQDPFVKVPLWWATAAAEATQTPRFLVCVELLHRSWKAKSLTFVLPNEGLRENGASRKVKGGVLHDLETAGLITIERRRGKSPRVTLVLL